MRDSIHDSSHSFIHNVIHNIASTTRGFSIPSTLMALACAASQPSVEPPATPEAPDAPSAEVASVTAPAAPRTIEVTLEPRSGSQLEGRATLMETPEGVMISLKVEHATPGDHGAHVHESGDCSAPDASSAGDHFNPSVNPHALPMNTPRHLGDLGNVNVAADGTGEVEIVAPGANLKEGDPNSFLGRAIIVHEKRDDGGQPSGNAGGRIGCGVVDSGPSPS